MALQLGRLLIVLMVAGAGVMLDQVIEGGGLREQLARIAMIIIAVASAWKNIEIRPAERRRSA